MFDITNWHVKKNDNLYLRLSDMIIVTDKGAEVITDYIPMEIDAIEKLMKEEGILQKYPKDVMK